MVLAAYRMKCPPNDCVGAHLDHPPFPPSFISFHFLSVSAQEAGPKTAPGRLHIAKAMVRKGVVSTVDSAFDQYIGDDGRAPCRWGRGGVV